MKRKDIEKKFSYILEKIPVNPKEGDCYEIPGNSISRQLKNLKEGSGKIFFLKIIYSILIPIIFYHVFSFWVWEWRNPKANQMTFYSHYVDMITFKTLPQYQ